MATSTPDEDTPERWAPIIVEVLRVLEAMVEAKLLTPTEADIVSLIYSKVPERAMRQEQGPLEGSHS